MQRILAGILAALVFVGLAGCGDDDGAAPNVVGIAVPFQPNATPLRFGDVPWPSDLYRSESGVVGDLEGLERLVGRPARLRRELIGLDGFGRATGAVFFTDADVDPASLPSTWSEATDDDASVLLVDVDSTSPHFGTRYPVFAKFLPSLGMISAIPVPGVVLPPGTRHALILTDRVRTRSGARLVAAPELDSLLDLAPSRRSTPAARLYGDAAENIVATGALCRSTAIAAMAVFTTSSRVDEIIELRQRLLQQPEPHLLLGAEHTAPYVSALFRHDTQPSLDDWLGIPERDESGVEWPGGDNPGGIAHDAIGAVASGAFVAPSFLAASGGFALNHATGDAELTQPGAKIPVTFVLPRQPAPPTGYPVVIIGHGLNNHRGTILSIANELARAGFALVGIDDVQHGARQGLADLRNNYPGTYRGPDGIPDTVGLAIGFFAGFSDFAAMRDNFRQSVLDHVSLVRLLRNPELDLSPLVAPAAAVPRLDPDRIFWSGGSLGGIMGTMVTAVEPGIVAAALQVPGANFVQLISTSSSELAPLVEQLTISLFGVVGDEAIDAFHPVGNLLAAVTEPGDPIAYAPHINGTPLLAERRPADILLTYAVYDEVLPNIATHALIRALGIDLARPRLFDLPGIRSVDAPVRGNLANGRTGAAVQYLPANHGLGFARYDGRKFFPSDFVDGAQRPRLAREFRFEQPVREHLQQLVRFFRSAAEAPGARIEVPVPPVADYDGDGLHDADEGRRGTDPYDPESR